MDEITRERVWRKLQVLPDAQLFQVLDYIEFLETKYASGRATPPTGLQRFAERLQDRLRGRSVAPEYITGAVGMLGVARRVVETSREVVSGVVQTGLGVVDEVVEAGREMLAEEPAQPGEASLPTGAGGERVDKSPTAGARERSAPLPPSAPPEPVPPPPPSGREAGGEQSPGT